MPCPEQLCLAGTTAVGKSAVALEIARLVGGEILSVDAMQVYRGMDVGTAKATVEERREIRHHLVDVVEPHESFSAGEFARLASVARAEIWERGRTPILCGGTGLYFEALFEGLSETPPSNLAVRHELESTPTAQLLDELAARDPLAFERIDRCNRRRVVRALEVIRISGGTFSGFRKDWSEGFVADGAWTTRGMVVLQRHPLDLVRRIDARTEGMFRSGLVEETRALLGRGLLGNRTAMQAIGYRQVVEYLEARAALPAILEEVKLKTRQFAKRQRSWFRNRARGVVLDVGGEETARVTAERVLELWDRGGRGRPTEP